MEAYKKNGHQCVCTFHLLFGWVKFSSINYLLTEQLKRTVKGCCRTLMYRENDHKQTVKEPSWYLRVALSLSEAMPLDT